MLLSPTETLVHAEEGQNHLHASVFLLKQNCSLCSWRDVGRTSSEAAKGMGKWRSEITCGSVYSLRPHAKTLYSYADNAATTQAILLLVRIRSAHLEIIGFPMGGAY